MLNMASAEIIKKAFTDSLSPIFMKIHWEQSGPELKAADYFYGMMSTASPKKSDLKLMD